MPQLASGRRATRLRPWRSRRKWMSIVQLLLLLKKKEKQTVHNVRKHARKRDSIISKKSTMKKPTHKKKLTVETSARAYLEDEVLLLKKHKLTRRLIVSFPKSKKTPFLGKVGMALVRMSGGIIDTMFADLPKK